MRRNRVITAVRLVGLATVAALALGASDGQTATPAPPYPQTINPVADQANISGVWVVREFALSTASSDKRRLTTIDGAPAPLQPWAQAIYDKRVKDTDDGTPFANTAAQCLPNGMPLMMYDAPYPFQVLQTPKQVTMIFEEFSTYRIIRLDQLPPQDPDAFYSGHSVGKFVGDTLVVETNGLVDNTTLDTMGMPHTDQLKVTERIRRIEPAVLEDVITLDDPGAFTRPWTFRRTYRLWPAGQPIREYVCENQRNAPTEQGHAGFH